MYLVRSNDRDAVNRIATDLAVLDDFPHCDLGELNSLALAELHPASSDWIASEPLVFSEESGIAIFGFAAEGVRWLRRNAEKLAEFGADPNAVRTFADAASEDNVFAVDTF